MNVKLKCLTGSARLYSVPGMLPAEAALIVAGWEGILTGLWAVGSASNLFDQQPGTLVVEMLEGEVGMLYMSLPKRDEFRTPTNGSDIVRVKVPPQLKFATHDSNALTVWTLGYGVPPLRKVTTDPLK